MVTPARTRTEPGLRADRLPSPSGERYWKPDDARRAGADGIAETAGRVGLHLADGRQRVLRTAFGDVQLAPVIGAPDAFTRRPGRASPP